jgi:hypothetical protein
MFSDRARAWKIAVALLMLMGLGAHYTRFALNFPEGYRAAVRSPETNDGANMLFPLWEVTHIRDASVYEISKTVSGVPVYGDASGLRIGDTVTVKGYFRASDGAVVERERIGHPHRKAKALLSLVGLLVVVGTAGRFFDFQNGRLVTRG